mgnify:CR=1 FL=1|tara:strand:- start:7623 stop:8339 length:717 start_codon:yes stop_codon:yes gene_type:complete
MLTKKDKLDFFSKILEKFKKNMSVRIDMHMHTNWTDGKNTVNEMYKKSCQKKLSHILFSEHSRKKSGKWFHKFSKEVRNLKKKRCTAYVGTEVKVLNFKGDLDLSKKIYKLCDFIMASVHRFPGEKGDMIMSRKNFKKSEAIQIEYRLMCSAIKNPKTDILGHPFGMSIKRFGARPNKKLFLDLMRRCKRKKVAFEINSAYHYNKNWLLEKCIDENIYFSLGSNAHKVTNVGNVIKKL